MIIIIKLHFIENFKEYLLWIILRIVLSTWFSQTESYKTSSNNTCDLQMNKYSTESWTTLLSP